MGNKMAIGNKISENTLRWTANSAFLGSREGARNSRAKKPKTGANERRKCLLFCSLFLLASVSPRCALSAFSLGYFARPFDYLERDC